MQDARASRAEAGRARRLDADQTDIGVVDEAREEPDRVRAAADAGDDGAGQRSFCGEDLGPCLLADHGLERAHDLRIRMRPRVPMR